MPPQDPAAYQRPGALQLPAPPLLSLYVHLPWCLRKCPYCDFNSHALRPDADAAALQARYVDALIADLEAALPLVWGRAVHSVFLGGGTPSLFAPEAIGRLIAGIRARLLLAPDCEITLEANPGTFERDRFAAFHDAGVTRLSIGVQSFDDDALRALGRVHDAAQARAAVEEAARVFESWNIDLMYALPNQSHASGQTIGQMERDLRAALACAPPHLSVYHLTIEPGTLFATRPPAVPDEDSAYAMLDRIAALTADAGLARYEVSAYARAGHRCAHNLNYWRFGDYLGIGAGAHGKLSFAHRIVRQVRYREPALYMDRALAGNAVAQEHDIARRDLAFEFMLNALRLKDGFALQDFTGRTGLPPSAIQAPLREAQRRGWIGQRLAPGGTHIAPTARGFDFLNDLLQLFLPD